ncbi:hypothetical protein EUX98_g7747 [Antrodiella citrinella]|uniref:Uncharacterized protein n=1 Tax=Antrodiella citrinella TaxID=2447956 RepID=A0A4S4MMG0_9APHY|nr:hypothetical protein EUX98_g7747 [Antrodiella citrinella]
MLLKQRNINLTTEIENLHGSFAEQVKLGERLQAATTEREHALASLMAQLEDLGRERDIDRESFRHELLESEKKYQDLLAEKPAWFDARYQEDEDARKVRKLHDLVIDRAGLRGKLDELETQIRVQNGVIQRDLTQEVVQPQVPVRQEDRPGGLGNSCHIF